MFQNVDPVMVFIGVIILVAIALVAYILRENKAEGDVRPVETGRLKLVKLATGQPVTRNDEKPEVRRNVLRYTVRRSPHYKRIPLAV